MTQRAVLKLWKRAQKAINKLYLDEVIDFKEFLEFDKKLLKIRDREILGK